MLQVGLVRRVVLRDDVHGAAHYGVVRRGRLACVVHQLLQQC